MPRPRRFPGINDTGGYVPSSDPEKFVSEHWRNQIALPKSERERMIVALRKMHHRTPGTHTDVLAVMQCVDALQRANPGFLLRASYLANEMTKRSDHYNFDAVSVGKMMAELTEMGEEAYLNYAIPFQPITRHSDIRGTCYAITDSAETYRWLFAIRQRLQDAAEKILEAEKQGLFAATPVTALIDIDGSAPE